MDFDGLGIGVMGERGLLGGGLMKGENEALYNLVLNAKPDLVCEVGTRRGGGSTHIISSALREVGKGMLHTAECDKTFYKQAVKFYDVELAHLKPYVTFHYGTGYDVFMEILGAIGDVDILFLDGIGYHQTVLEYELFKPKLKKGSYLACHDWHIGKMKKLRPIIEADADWEEILVMKNTLTGFAIHRKKA